ncbi:NUDIX domain-containing protein [Bacillus sp. JJ664]
MFTVNVEAAINHDGKWLVIERSKKEEHAGGMLSLVGGTVELGQQPIEILESNLKREVLEEVDVEIKNVNYLYSSAFVTDKNEHVLNIVFLCEYKSGIAYPKSPDEVEDVKWMTSDEIERHSKAPVYLKESIEQAELKMGLTS